MWLHLRLLYGVMATEPIRHLPDLDHVGVRELKNKLSAVLDGSVRRGRSVVITTHNRPDAVLVPPADYEALVAERERREQLSATVAMLLAAAAAGVRIPSETLDDLGLNPAQLDWRALNAFQARYPVAIIQDEEGRPLATTDIPLEQLVLEEDDEELMLDG
jgi:prevent-host-death family protein